MRSTGVHGGERGGNSSWNEVVISTGGFRMASSSRPSSDPSELMEERTDLPPPRCPRNLSNTDLNEDMFRV